MKRTLSLMLALVMVLGTFSMAFAAIDVTDAEKEAGAFLKANEVLKGDEQGDLLLANALKKQNSVVLLSRLMKVEELAKNFPVDKDKMFPDVTDPFYEGYIAWAVEEGLIEGKGTGEFGFDASVTAREFATMVLRSLGHTVGAGKDVEYDNALETAIKLGVAEKGTEDGIVSRGAVALMVFNALSVKIKDTDMTLAEKLGIKMPADEVAKELKVVEVKSENLKEVMVMLSNAKLAEVENLEDTNNFRVDGKVAHRVTIDGDNLIVELKDKLVDGKEYDLKIRNIDKAVDGTYKFRARDNTIPMVEEVKALGEYGIKVTLSEPVIRVNERDFLIDGRNVTMKTENYGRTVILTPYRGSFSDNAAKLTVKSLEDYAGFKSAEVDFDIEIVKDEVAPVVTDVVVKGNVVEVTFDKDIYKASVEGYDNRSNVGNIYYTEGRRDFFADIVEDDDNDRATKTDYNKAEYKFKEELPRNATVTIEGVQNHSKVTMEKTTKEVREVIDYREPEIIETDIETTLNKAAKTATVKVELSFNKDVTSIRGDSVNDAKFKDHFTLYGYGEVLNRNVVKAEDITSSSVKYDGSKKDVVIVEFAIKNVDVANEEFDYVLEIMDFEDSAYSRNRMFRYYLDIELEEESKKLTIDEIKVENVSRSKVEVTIKFNKAVDVRTAKVLENYVFKNSAKNKDLDQLDGEVITTNGDKNVILILPDMDTTKLLKDYDTLTVAAGIKDRDDNRLGKDYVFDLATGKQLSPVVAVDKDALVAAINAGAAEVKYEADYTATSFAAMIAKWNVAVAVKDDAKATQAQVDTATKALNDAIKALELKVPETVKKSALIAAIAAGEAKDEAKYTETSFAAMMEKWNVAVAVRDDKNATQAQVDVATKALNDAIEALKLVEVPTPTDKLNATISEDIHGDTLVVSNVTGTVTKVTLNGKLLVEADFDYGFDGTNLRIALEDEGTNAKVIVTMDGNDYTVVIK